MYLIIYPPLLAHASIRSHASHAMVINPVHNAYPHPISRDATRRTRITSPKDQISIHHHHEIDKILCRYMLLWALGRWGDWWGLRLRSLAIPRLSSIWLPATLTLAKQLLIISEYSTIYNTTKIFSGRDYSY